VPAWTQKGQERRSDLMSLRLAAQKLPHPDEQGAIGSTELPRAITALRECGRGVLGPNAIVTYDASTGKAGTRGIATCGRALVCATCGAKVREERRQHLLKMIDAAQSQDVGVYFVTLTLRHFRGTNLETSLEVIRSAWQKLASGKSWQSRKEKFGLGMVGVIEITDNADGNGWHPHLHLCILQSCSRVKRENGEWVKVGDERPPKWNAKEEAEFAVWLRQRWLSIIVKSGMPAALPQHAFDWREAYGPEDARLLSAYLAKDQGASIAAARMHSGKLSAEMLRGDLKTKRRSEHATRPVFELLADAARGDAVAWQRWWEYEAAVRGLRFWRVSHGLATSLGVVDDARTDEEIAADQDSRGIAVIKVNRRDWWNLATNGEVPRLLTLVETSGVAVALAWLLSVGAHAERIEDPGG
jgi:hypothetical protein